KFDGGIGSIAAAAARGKMPHRSYFMKKTVFLAAALIALATAAAFAQTEADFDTQNSADGKSVTVTDYKGTATTVNIPARIRNMPVTVIGDSSFAGLDKITSVTIPAGVTYIGVGAFQDCKSLVSVNIPNTVTSVGPSAFRGCAKLTSVNIPNSVTSIGMEAFYNCANLVSVTLSNNMVYLTNGVFQGCTKLNNITIPANIQWIQERVFYNCSGLTSITIPASVTEVGGNAFRGCTGLTSVTFSGGLAMSRFSSTAFNGLGDIRDKFYAANAANGTPGRYMRSSGTATVWAKQ
ncbi:MAG: leucine-rich repeat domain-containing protein, partial [Treponema sp.]|nr:leucine-rich repeat domain-containing protein [Treponema sp.]